MSELKVGDRVEVISDINENGISVGCRGTIVDIEARDVTVDFDNYISSCWVVERGRDGHCLRISFEYLKKVEETEKEPKINAMEQKILKVLRAEIGVDIGEEFDVYDNGEKQWTCKFDKNGFFHVINDEFYKSGVWKDIVYNFCRYTFKRKPFVPQDGEKYWHFEIRGSLNGNKSLDILENVWDSLLFDYGMLALGNVFRNREEAIKGEDKLLERLNELLKGEWIWKSCCKS